MFRLFAPIALATTALVLPGTASAQAPGMAVVDTAGGSVGTVVAVKADLITVKTDKHEVALPKASFTPHEGKLLFGMTQAELNAATEKSLAEAAAAIQAGATVKGTAGGTVGTIDTLDADFVTIKLASGNLVRIPRTGIVGSADGVLIGMTAEQLEAQVSASAAPAEDAPAQ